MRAVALIAACFALAACDGWPGASLHAGYTPTGGALDAAVTPPATPKPSSSSAPSTSPINITVTVNPPAK